MISYFVLFLTIGCLGFSNGLCPKNAIPGSRDGSCYFGIDVNETFSNADSFCSNYFYGNLASISSAQDDTRILDLARNLFKSTDNVFLGGVFDGTDVVWLDGSPDVYQNFGSAETQPGNLVLDLVSGKWSTATWDVALPFVCIQKDITQPTLSPPVTVTPECPVRYPCPTEWTHSQPLNACYKTIFYVTFDQANSLCVSMGSNLASIHSDEENRLINELMQTNYWINNDPDAGLVGGKRTGPGASEWVWTDGTPWDFTLWAQGEPNFKDGQEFCLQLYSDPSKYAKDPTGDRQKWNDVSCNQQMRIAMCKRQADF